MKRRIILGSLLVVGGLSIAIAAQQQQQPKTLEVTKLKDNLYVLKPDNGGGGNTSVFITANGVVVVDSKNPGWGQPILDKIKTLTDKPVTTIDQHAYARRSRERQRRVPGDRRHHRPGEHRRRT